MARVLIFIVVAFVVFVGLVAIWCDHKMTQNYCKERWH